MTDGIQVANVLFCFSFRFLGRWNWGDATIHCEVLGVSSYDAIYMIKLLIFGKSDTLGSSIFIYHCSVQFLARICPTLPFL